MDKRLFIAVMLSIAFLFAWGAIAPRIFPELAKPPAQPKVVPAQEKPVPSSEFRVPSPQTTTTGSTASQNPEPGTRNPEPIANVQPISANEQIETVVQNEYFIARFTNRGGQLVSFKLKNYTQKNSKELVDLVTARASGASDFPFAIVSADAALNRRANQALYVVKDDTQNGVGELQYRYTDPSGVSILKTFTFGAEAYRFAFNVQTDRPVPYRIAMGPGIRTLSPEEQTDKFIRAGNAVIQQEGSFEIIPREKAKDFDVLPGMPEFVGLEDNYFLAVWQPRTAGDASLRSVPLPAAKKGTTRREFFVGLNAVNGRVNGDAFFGPKETDLLDRYGLDQAMQFGMFGFIARLLLAALKWLYGITHNYGWAIVVLTIIIKVLLYPLQHKSIVSMKKMQRLQPKMNAIKDKYKKAKTDPDQRQRMNVEMTKLYQAEGINPMSGCLPILLQLPILWAFYSLLSVAIELRGADFILWINDLSAKDPYYITPILMTITMFIQQWMTPTTADPAQRKVFLAMPFIFGWIFKEFPSGLVLYWLVQNILSIIQQWIMNKYWKDHPDELKDKPAEKAVQPLKQGKATTRAGCLFTLLQ